MVDKGFAYVGHLFANGVSVIDVRDPRKPKAVEFIPAPPNTWNLHLQVHDGLMLVIHAKNMWAQPELADERNYYRAKTGDIQAHARVPQQQSWSAGMAIYDVSTPGKPKEIGFMPIKGGGLHRIWYVGGRWAYASAFIEGFSDYIMITIDLADPTNPKEAGRFWLPGMKSGRRRNAELADDDRPLWLSSSDRCRRHRLLQLARRLPRDCGCQGSERAEADRASDVGAERRRGDPQLPSAARP